MNQYRQEVTEYVKNSDKIKEIAQIEQLFWRWAFSVVDNLIIESDRFDETRSIPIDWYPPFTSAPYARHNKGVTPPKSLSNSMEGKLILSKGRLTILWNHLSAPTK